MLIEMRRIEKVYRMGKQLVHALAGIDLTIDAGEMVSIMGPSGSGKSTMMNILGCLDRPTAGTPALANVMLPLIYQGARDRRRRAEAALERVGMADRMTHRPSELSGGQQQRVAVARALVTEPAIILADEPTGNLDTRTSQEIMQLFRDLNEDGVTIVLVTHNDEIGACGKRIVRMRDGRIVSDGPAAYISPYEMFGPDAVSAEVSSASLPGPATPSHRSPPSSSAST
jgi:putative ABC transport system ATP-binding protein